MFTIANLDGGLSFDRLTDELYGLYEQAWHETANEPFNMDYDRLKQVYESGNVFAHPVRLDGRAVGFVVYDVSRHPFNFERKDLRVQSVYVEPRYRRGPFFAEVMRFIRRTARERGCNGICMQLPERIYKNKRLSRLGGIVDYNVRMGVKNGSGRRLHRRHL